MLRLAIANNKQHSSGKSRSLLRIPTTTNISQLANSHIAQSEKLFFNCQCYVAAADNDDDHGASAGAASFSFLCWKFQSDAKL